MNNLGDTAQNIMDLYYQQFKSDEDFFELIHFKFLASAVYAKVLQDEYEKSYNRNAAENGVGEAQMNPEWYIAEDIDIVQSDLGEREAALKNDFFTFRFDKQFSGILTIIPVSGSCRDFIRTSIEETWKNTSGVNAVFWYPMKKRIIFNNVKCGLKKAKILYIPALETLDDESPIPQAMTEDIVTRTLQVMFAARQGVVIDMTSDKNPNKVLESEINQRFKNVIR